ncbi:hypothetical protein GC194_10790 [bacterium]|nr:hypothetical protein [bacterium]
MNTQEVTTKLNWGIDAAHSEIGFKVKHLMVSKVRGTFQRFKGSIATDGNDFEHADIDLTIHADSIQTGDEKRDAHLRSADFFDVENFGTIRFNANGLEKANSRGDYRLTGNLEMKGISKEIGLDVEFGGIVKDPWGNEKAVFAVTGKINRKDWGLNWNAALETGGVLVSEEVQIECEVQLAKQG